MWFVPLRPYMRHKIKKCRMILSVVLAIVFYPILGYNKTVQFYNLVLQDIADLQQLKMLSYFGKCTIFWFLEFSQV